MINKESEIAYYFVKEPWRKYTFSELMRISNKNSRSYLERVLKKLACLKMIQQEKISNLVLYSLNITSARARIFAGFVLENDGWDKKNIPYSNLQGIIDKIPCKSSILLITGSYAKNKQTEKSDIDVVIIIEDSCSSKRVYAELMHFCEINIPQIHLYVFKNKEFIKMLCNKEANYGKEIVKNNLILTNGQNYIQLISEAISHGFRN